MHLDHLSAGSLLVTHNSMWAHTDTIQKVGSGPAYIPVEIQRMTLIATIAGHFPRISWQWPVRSHTIITHLEREISKPIVERNASANLSGITDWSPIHSTENQVEVSVSIQAVSQREWEHVRTPSR